LDARIAPNIDADRHFVLVLEPVDGVPGQAWVLHPFDPGYLTARSWPILRSPRRPRLTLVLSDLADWAACLRKQLAARPETPAGPPAPRPAPAVVRALGDGPAASVLRWVLRCLGPDAPGGARVRTVCWDCGE
jgi:hypothetical protein